MATDTRNPTSDISATGTWTGTAGTRFQSINDYPDSGNPINSGLTHGTTAGALVLGFSAFSIPAGSTAISVQVQYFDFKNGSQSSAARSLIRCNDTTDRTSGTHNPGNGNANIASRSDNFATNPKSGVAWTVDDVNGVGTNGLTAFGLGASDASPTITFSSVQLQVTYTPPVTGDLAATGPADTAASTGTVEWVGNLSSTEGTDVLAASGTVSSASGFTGDLAATEPSDTASGSATSQWIAALASTEALDAAASSATVAWIAALAASETKDSAAASATSAWIANLAAAESPDVLAASDAQGGGGYDPSEYHGEKANRKICSLFGLNALNQL